jgi:UDP-N-acetylglucosamine 2-epimerase (non-hydrolysing)
MTKRIKILAIFGTRPELIKFAPIIKQMSISEKDFDIVTCATAQHRQMLDQALEFFNIQVDYDLDLMEDNQSLERLTSRSLKAVSAVISEVEPDLVLVQGDTTTAFTGALAAFYQKVPIGHIEAGLRTNNLYAPFPEEGNRKLISSLTAFHFAPTRKAAENLHGEGIKTESINITGNTVIDSLLMAKNKIEEEHELNKSLGDWFSNACKYSSDITSKKKRMILITQHRRENFGSKLDDIFKAFVQIANDYPDVVLVYPVHLNPNVHKVAHEKLSKISNFFLIPPASYAQLIYLMMHSYLIITDSGGIQEEAPSLKCPVIVTREESERPEGVDAGCSKLVGSDYYRILSNVSELLDNKKSYENMLVKNNPYGNGHAANSILEILIDRFRNN